MSRPTTTTQSPPTTLTALKLENKNRKTLNLDGVLFLINDTCDELGTHYLDLPKNPPLDIEEVLLRRRHLHPYFFAVIPDKSVILSEYLHKYPPFKRCVRRTVDYLRRLNFFIDPLSTIQKLEKETGYPVCSPGDTHPNLLSQYAVYTAVMEQLQLPPYKFEIIPYTSQSGDLCCPINLGDGDISNLQTWKLPSVIQKSTPKFTNYQIEMATGRREKVTHNEYLKFKRCNYMDFYLNEAAADQRRILVFHDSNLFLPLGSKTPHGAITLTAHVKEWYAAHFKESYFFWSTYDPSLVTKFAPDLVLEIQMERFFNEYRCVDTLFDATYYRNKYPDIRDMNPRIHYLLFGISEGRFPNKFFEIETSITSTRPKVNKIDESSYLATYHLVRKFTQEFPEITPLIFYQIYGWKMGHLSPIIEKKKLNSPKIISTNFDPTWYRRTYGEYLYPLFHYLMQGQKDKRSPNQWFQEDVYLRLNPDVEHAVKVSRFSSGFDHYLQYGYRENRRII